MSFGTISEAIAIWLVCATLWLIFGQRRLGSPVFIYLVFHFITFVVRPWFIYSGSDQRFLRQWIGVWLGPEDHASALWQSNIGLIMFTIGGLLGEARARARPAPRRAAILDSRVVHVVGSVFLLLSVFTYFRYSGVGAGSLLDPGSQRRYVVIDSTQGYTSISATSAYVSSFYNVAIGVAIVWLALFGFRRYIVALVAFVLLGFALQGFARTFYVVGAFAIGLVALRLQGRRWPSPRIAVLGLVIFFAFAAGKSWAWTAASDGPYAGYDEAKVGLQRYFSSEGETFITYDTTAATIHLIPRYAPHSDLHLYGRLIYGWVPRALWSDKPIFDFASGYIQSRIHRVSFQGLAVSIVGESYMAFGLPSVVLFMAIYGYFFGFLVAWCFRYPVTSVQFIFGIALCAITPQIYRDGIQPIMNYLLYYFGPCLIMWFVGVLVGRSRSIQLIEQPEQAPGQQVGGHPTPRLIPESVS